MTDHICPDTPQTRAAWSRVAAGMEAMVWVRMEVQPPGGYAPDSWLSDSMRGESRRTFCGERVQIDESTTKGMMWISEPCPVRPGDRVGWREIWTIVDVGHDDDCLPLVTLDYRHPQDRITHILGWADKVAAETEWQRMKQLLANLEVLGDGGDNWMDRESQPAWSIRRWAVAGPCDVGRPLYMSLDEWRKSLNVDGRTEEKARATFVGEKFQKDHIREAFGDDAGLLWWKVKVKPTEKVK